MPAVIFARTAADRDQAAGPVQYIEFEREARRLDDAVLSAVTDVEKVPA